LLGCGVLWPLACVAWFQIPDSFRNVLTSIENTENAEKPFLGSKAHNMYMHHVGQIERPNLYSSQMKNELLLLYYKNVEKLQFFF
jgi:hypothetical protein